jgi:hypothetical protein
MLQEDFISKKRIDHSCASVQLNRWGDVCSVSKVLWTPEFLQFADHNLGVLEAVGLLLPFLSVPSELKNREIILQTDNLAVVFAWNKRYAKNDEKLSLFIQTLHVIEAALPCKIYVEHVHRCSTYAAWLADAFTRGSTTPIDFLRKNRNLKIHKPKSPLQKMFRNPSVNWMFPLELADHVVNVAYEPNIEFLGSRMYRYYFAWGTMICAVRYEPIHR